VNVLTCFDHVFRDESGAIHGSTGHCCLAISDLKQPAFEVKQKAQAAEQQNREVFFGVFLFWPSVSRDPSPPERGKRDLQLRIQKTIKILEEQAICLPGRNDLPR